MNQLLKIICFCFMPWWIYGQSLHLKIDQFTREDGLSGNHITDVVKDSSGFLWISTTEGLNCYDGDRVTSYFNSEQNSDKANEIKDLLLLPGNRLAVAADGGLFIFDINTRQFHKLEVRRNRPDLLYLDNSFSCLQMVKKGRFFAGSWTGVHEFDVFSGQIIHSFFADESRLFRERLSYTKSLSLAPDSSAAVFAHIDFKENWVKLDFENKKTKPIQDVFPGWNPTIKQKITLPSDWELTGNLSNVEWFMSDHENSYWGGNSAGLYHVFLQKTVFQEFAPLSIFLKKIKTENVADALLFHNKLWIGTGDKGLIYYDLATEKVALWKPSEHLGKSYCDQVWNLRLQHDGRIWVGCGCGYFWIDPETMKSGRIDMQNKPPEADQEIGVYQFKDSKGLIWMGLGNGNGLLRYNPANKQCHYYLPVTLGGSFPLRHPIAIVEDKTGDLWFGTQRGGGLVRWDRQRDSFSVILPGTRPGFDGDLVEDMVVDHQGKIWLAIQQIGLVRFERDKNKFTVFGRHNGLTTTYISQVTIDDDDRIWLATLFGIQCFDQATERFSLFLKKDGLPDNSITSIHHSGDSLLIGMPGNFRFLTTNDFFKKKDPPPVFLTQILVNGQEIPLPANGQLTLRHDQNDLQFRVTALDLEEGKKAQMMYRLVRADNSWKDVSVQRVVNYANMSPGDYFFEMRAAFSNSNWGKDTVLLHLIILPPWWATGWFRLVVLGGLMLFAWGFYRNRIRQLLEIQQVRNNISRDLHDDIGATLSNIEILSNIGSQQANNPEQAKQFLERITTETRQANDNLHQIVWNINPANDDISKLLARLTRYSAETLETSGIVLHLDAPPDLPHFKMGLEKRRDLFFLFKEALNNIVRHANATEVNISIQIKGKKLIVSIQDNGKGFDPTVPKHGNGLHNMQQRMSKWSGLCTINTKLGEGTMVQLSLPV